MKSRYSYKPTCYQRGILCQNGFNTPNYQVEKDTRAEITIVDTKTGDRYAVPKWKVEPRKLW